MQEILFVTQSEAGAELLLSEIFLFLEMYNVTLLHLSCEFPQDGQVVVRVAPDRYLYSLLPLLNASLRAADVADAIRCSEASDGAHPWNVSGRGGTALLA